MSNPGKSPMEIQIEEMEIQIKEISKKINDLDLESLRNELNGLSNLRDKLHEAISYDKLTFIENEMKKQNFILDQIKINQEGIQKKTNENLASIVQINENIEKIKSKEIASKFNEFQEMIEGVKSIKKLPYWILIIMSLCVVCFVVGLSLILVNYHHQIKKNEKIILEKMDLLKKEDHDESEISLLKSDLRLLLKELKKTKKNDIEK